MGINFSNFTFNISTVILGIFFIVSTIFYILIFYKHHKRNRLEISEVLEIYMKYIVLLGVSIFILIIAFDMFLTGLSAIEYRKERYTNFVAFVIVTSLVIWNFIRFLKSNLKDIEVSSREENKKNTAKIGEVLELIFLSIIIFMPIWRIPEFVKLIEDKKELFIQIGISFFYSIMSIFILFKLNPLNIKDKLK